MDDLKHWHAVYNISTVSSPTQEINNEINGYEALNNKFSTNKRLSLIKSDMQVDEETTLRSLLSQKLNRMETLKVGSEVLPIANFTSDYDVQVYYNVLSIDAHDLSQTKTVFLVCFIVSTISGLELFQTDLNAYCEDFLPALESSMTSSDVNEGLSLLDVWYDAKICYIDRCLKYFPENLHKLLYSSFCNDVVEFENVPDKKKNDIQRFLENSSLSLIVQEKDSEHLSSLNNDVVLKMTYSKEDESFFLPEKAPSSRFCEECISSMETHNSPLKKRQLLENYKSKTIQEMNTFKRLVRQCESSFYSLYKSYLFLTTNGNGNVIMKNATLQSDNSQETKDILKIISDFLQSPS